MLCTTNLFDCSNLNDTIL